MNEILIAGIIIVLGIAGARIINRIKFPSVVGWLIVGAVLGQSALKLITPELLDKLGFVSDITLGLIGVIIGIEITIGTLKKLGGGIIAVIFAESFGAFLLVFAGVWLLTRNLPLALLLGSLAPASAPAGTVAVLQEYNARGPLTKALLIVVGMDDALGIIIYVFASAYAKVLVSGATLSVTAIIGKPLLEIAVAVVCGAALGWLFGFLTRKVYERDVILSMAVGAVLVCVGLAKFLNFSLILSNVVLGMVIVNAFPRIARPLSESLGSFIPPFYVCFFALAGAHFNLPLLLKMGGLGIIYIICRAGGLMGGAFAGSVIGKQSEVIRKYLGFGILSQAGVAVGLAYLIVREFAPLGLSGQKVSVIVLTIIAATTIIFEIIGPVFTKFAIIRAGEARKPGGSA